MSRIGKNPILIPDKVKCSRAGEVISIQGPLGTVSRSFNDKINILIADNNITLTPKRQTDKALWGTYAAHLRNMVKGVTTGYEKKLIIEGIGYRAAVTGKKITFNLGWSHSYELAIPEGLKITSEKNLLTISGFDKDLVGQFTATIRALKKPEPYKGKGIRYESEVVRRKAGKKVASTTAA